MSPYIIIIMKTSFPLPPAIDQKYLPKLQQLVEVFLLKNQELNLSSIRDADAVWQKHIYDSLLAYGEIKREEGSRKKEERKNNFKLQSSSFQLLDIGSGGGFPAFPLSICLPNVEITAMDSVGKKMTAVQQMADALVLQNLRTLVGRCEDLAQEKLPPNSPFKGGQYRYREQFDLVTARAVANWSTLLELTAGFVKVGGLLVLYLGPSARENNLDLAEVFHLKIVSQQEFQLPGGEERLIWVLQKTQKLNKKYPRMNGLPKQEPIIL